MHEKYIRFLIKSSLSLSLGYQTYVVYPLGLAQDIRLGFGDYRNEDICIMISLQPNCAWCMLHREGCSMGLHRFYSSQSNPDVVRSQSNSSKYYQGGFLGLICLYSPVHFSIFRTVRKLSKAGFTLQKT